MINRSVALVVLVLGVSQANAQLSDSAKQEYKSMVEGMSSARLSMEVATNAASVTVHCGSDYAKKIYDDIKTARQPEALEKANTKECRDVSDRFQISKSESQQRAHELAVDMGLAEPVISKMPVAVTVDLEKVRLSQSTEDRQCTAAVKVLVDELKIKPMQFNCMLWRKDRENDARLGNCFMFEPQTLGKFSGAGIGIVMSHSERFQVAPVQQFANSDVRISSVRSYWNLSEPITKDVQMDLTGQPLRDKAGDPSFRWTAVSFEVSQGGGPVQTMNAESQTTFKTAGDVVLSAQILTSILSQADQNSPLLRAETKQKCSMHFTGAEILIQTSAK